MLMALLLIPILLAIGMAVDFAQAIKVRASMQNALDAASLTAVRLPPSASKSERAELLFEIYAANLGPGQPKLDRNLLIVDDRGSIKTSAHHNMKTSFMGLVGKSTIPLSVKAQAGVSQTLKDAAFRMIGATGVWSKSITLMGRKKGTTKFKPLLKMQYDYNGASFGNLEAIGSLTASRQIGATWKPVYKINCDRAFFRSQCVKQELTKGAEAQVNVSSMSEIYLEMTMWATDDVGKRHLRRIRAPTTLKSNDPVHANRLFIKGVQQKKGNAVDLQKAIGCGKWQEQRWEDGGGHDRTTPWDGADFRYEVRGICGWDKTASPRLEK